MRSGTRALAALILSILFLLTRSAPAVAQMPDTVGSGGLLLQADSGYLAAPALNTDINIRVNGLVARVSVMQEFENDSADWVEGLYLFPLPETAAVDHMRMYIGARLVEGEIREKEEARREYQQAKASGRKTSLVEQQRANLFTTAVANIAPGEKVIVEIEYLEDLHFDSGTFSLRYPMTLTPRYSGGIEASSTAVAEEQAPTPPLMPATRGQRISLQASINAGMPLGIVASRYHPVNVAETAGTYLISLAGGQAPMDHDFELLWRPIESAVPRAMVFEETVDGLPHYLLMLVPPAATLTSTTSQSRELILVIDTSGSMHGESLQQAKLALQTALKALRTNDYFNVIEFNSRTTPLFPASVMANDYNIRSASEFVAALRAEGGTEMYPALDFALRTPRQGAQLRQVIFITDGAVDNEEGLFQLIEAQLQDARLFTVGIGSAPNSWLMRKAAEVGRGAFTTIGDLHEVGEKIERLLFKLESPQLTDIDVQWPSGVVMDSYPDVVPDLYLGEPVVVKARASGVLRAGDQVRITGNSVSGGWSSEVALAGNSQSAGVAALWARARIAGLLDQQRRGGDLAQTRASVVATALAYHLVSKYTSLVAVDKTPARTAADALLQKRVGNLQPRGMTAAPLAGMATTATGAELLRRNGALCLLLGVSLLLMPMLRRRKSCASVV